MAYVLNIRDENGKFIPINAIKGDKGEKGDKGDSYVLTEADKQEIANKVCAFITNGDEVSY